MNNGFWAADAIGTNLGRIADNERSARALANQQGYHCGDLAIQRAALDALRAIQPDHPIFCEPVRERIYEMGEREFRGRGWAAGSALTVDANQIHRDLLVEFENQRSAAIAKAQAELVKHRRMGWFLINRRPVWCWSGIDHPTPEAANAAKQTELQRLASARLGHPL
jgi:hypothetical protein